MNSFYFIGYLFTLLGLCGLFVILLLRLRAIFKYDGFLTAAERDAYLESLKAEFV